MLLRIAQAYKQTFGCRLNQKTALFRFCSFTMDAKAEKNSLLKHSELNSFRNMVIEIDIDALNF